MGDGPEPQDICDRCGRVLADDQVYVAVVADSSAVYAHHERLDGQRLILACCAEHLADLRASYGRRPFVEAELWAGKIARTRSRYPGRLTGQRLRRETGLSDQQIRKGLAWRPDSTWLPLPRSQDGRG